MSYSKLLKAAIERRATRLEEKSEYFAGKSQALYIEARKLELEKPEAVASATSLKKLCNEYSRRSLLKGRQYTRLRKLLADWDIISNDKKEYEVSLILRYLTVDWDVLLEAGEKNCYDCENNDYCNKKGIEFASDGCIFSYECDEVDKELDKCNASIINMLTSEEPVKMMYELHDEDEVTDAIPSLDFDQEALRADWALCEGCEESEECDGLHSNICPYNPLYQMARISAQAITEAVARLF